MIFIIHGENFSKTRKVVTDIQQKLGVTNKTETNINEITPQQLAEMCASYDLFSTPPFVVVDVSDAGRRNLAEYLEVLKSLPNEVNVVIQSNKELSNANIFNKNAAVLKAKTVMNKLEPGSDVFKFLDALYSKKRDAAYRELKNLMLDETDPFYIFSMIVYGFRNIAYTVTNSPMVSKLHPFVKGKVQSQAKGFSEEKVKELFGLLYKIDKDLKTGKIPPGIAPAYTIEQILKEK